MNFKDRRPAKQQTSAIDDDDADDDDDDDHNVTAAITIGKGRQTAAKWRLMVLVNMNTTKIWRVTMMIWWREEHDLWREEKSWRRKRMRREEKNEGGG